jgi:hypothetical protein
MSETKRFRIMGTRIGTEHGYVPLEFMLRFNARAQSNHGGQTIARLNQRGGLCAQEAMAAVTDQRYDDRTYRTENEAWARLIQIVSGEFPHWDFQAGEHKNTGQLISVARDEWIQSEALGALDPVSIGAPPSAREYLENRLKRAFEAGANAALKFCLLLTLLSLTGA